MRVLSKTYRHKPLASLLVPNGEAQRLALPLLEVASRLITGRTGVSAFPLPTSVQPLFFDDCDPSIIVAKRLRLRPKTRLEAL